MNNILLEIALRLRRLYWRVARPETVGARAVVINDLGEVLLVKHKYGKGWFLPGGKIKKNEAIEDGLRRELGEELGITSLVIDRVLGTYTNVQEYKRDTITVYVVRKFSQVKKTHFEIDSQSFFAPDKLPDGVSPGTYRRINEYLGQQSITTNW